MLPALQRYSLQIAAGLLVLFVVLRAAVIPGGFAGFIAAGTEHCDASVPVSKVEGPGYDGQYFYRYALAPFDTQNPSHGILTDTPAYRHQRIGYPLMAWLFSLGYAPAVPYLMVLLNLAYFFLLAAGVKKLFGMLNREVPPLVVLLVPGLWMSFARNLAEVQEAVLFVYLVLAFLSGRKLLFLLLATAMVFTREPSAVILGAFGLYHLLAAARKEHDLSLKQRAGWIIVAAVPCILFLVFRMALFAHYGQGAGEGADDFNPVPFGGLAEGFAIQLEKTRQTGLSGWIELAFYLGNIGLIVCWLIAGTAAVTKSWSVLKPHQQWLWLLIMAWLAIIMLFSYKIWEDDWGFTRILTIPVLASVLIGRLSRPVLLMAALFTALTFARLVVRV